MTKDAFQVGDCVTAINGPFQGFGLVIDDNRFNKALVVYHSYDVHGNAEEEATWCKYDWLERVNPDSYLEWKEKLK